MPCKSVLTSCAAVDRGQPLNIVGAQRIAPKEVDVFTLNIKKNLILNVTYIVRENLRFFLFAY